MKTLKKEIPTPEIGDILREEFLEPLSVSGYKLAKELHVSTSTILDILHNKRKLTVDMALRLSRYFGTSDRFWLNLQNGIEIRNKRRSLKNQLKEIHPLEHSA